MAVTELARLRLLAGTEPSTPTLLANLAKAKAVMEEASGFKFHYYHCVEDPNVIFIIGAWPSVQFHMQHFIPGRPNQELLALLKDQVTVEWMFHLDIDPTKGQLPLTRDFVAIGRHFIKEGDLDGFRATFGENKHALESFIGGPSQFAWGFRMDKGFDPSLEREKQEEFVLFTAWNSVEHHCEFAKEDGLKKYMQIKDHLEGVDIKHAALLDVGGTARN